jgi:hypothetical protein
MSRRAGCPGSAAAEARYPYDDTQSEIAKEGTAMHCAMGQLFDPDVIEIKLEPEQIRSCEKAFRTYERFAAENGFDGVPEQELKIKSKIGFTVIIDAVLVQDRRALVLDWKFGRGEVESAESNWQLACAVVAIREKYGILTEAFAAIIQPRAENLITATHYESEAAILRVQDEIAAVILRAKRPDAPRIPGEHCRYCRHIQNCPEAAEQVKAMVQIDKTPEMLDASTLAKFLDKAKAVKPIIEALEDEAKKRLGEGLQVPGYRLRAGNKYRSVDPEDAFKTLRRAIVPTDQNGKEDAEEFARFKSQFWGALKLSISEVDSMISDRYGLIEKKTKEKVQEIFGDRLKVEQGNPILVREKNGG